MKPVPPKTVTLWFVVQPDGAVLGWTGGETEATAIKTYIDSVFAAGWAAFHHKGFRCIKFLLDPVAKK